MLALSFTAGSLLAVLLLAVVVAGAFLIYRFMDSKVGDMAMKEDASVDVPATGLPEDDGAALGSTEEVHTSISPHDLPIDHPGRQAAEEQAEGPGAAGTTRGDQEGGAAGEGGPEEGTGEKVGDDEADAAKLDR